MPLSLGAFDDVVVGSSSFKSPNMVGREILGSNPSLSRSNTTKYSFYFIGTITGIWFSGLMKVQI
ncbi:hypothetical protein CFP56_015780 [Quercus suber]|uniref:NADH-plastoquinone oxidoreductase subunit 5 n=1 Tax=Quercus suber TaxID=58331 RepID=A0AAW0KRK0_QUESU